MAVREGRKSRSVRVLAVCVSVRLSMCVFVHVCVNRSRCSWVAGTSSRVFLSQPSTPPMRSSYRRRWTGCVCACAWDRGKKDATVDLNVTHHPNTAATNSGQRADFTDRWEVLQSLIYCAICIITAAWWFNSERSIFLISFMSTSR